MTLSRRSFLTACIASACAPAIVRASFLMKLSPAKAWDGNTFPFPPQFSSARYARPVWPGTVIPGAFSAWIYDGTNWVESKNLQLLDPSPGATRHFICNENAYNSLIYTPNFVRNK